MERTMLDAYARFMRRINDTVTNLPGGPPCLKSAWVINFQKGGTLPFVAILMAIYGNYSAAAWVYLALHGSYGLCWLLKDRACPDPVWERRVTIPAGIMMFLLILGPYWVIAWIAVSGFSEFQPSIGFLAGVIVLHTLGVVIMMVSDAQKFFTLRVRKGLIREGMFRYVRHPNYLGEMMVYGSYALIAGHSIPWLILAWVWLGLFVPNMVLKEASMSRYPEWSEYKRKSGMLLPLPW